MTTIEEAVRQMKESKDVASPMPRYRCHKEVCALKIMEVLDPTQPGNESDGSMIIVPENPFAPFCVDRTFVRKHDPQPGGYFVRYQDGYTSFSPAQAFEEGYTRL